MISEVEEALAVSEGYWWLTLKDEQITPASYLETFFNYVAAFFTDSHRQALCDRLLVALNACEKGSEALQIVLEKISALRANGGGIWFQEISLDLPPYTPTFSTQEGTKVFPHQILPVREGERFYNYPGEDLWSQFWETQRLLFVGARDHETHLESLSESFCFAKPPVHRNETDAPLITWLGHASVLIQVSGVNILCDPSFGFVFPCFLRHTEPGIPLKKLPLIDVILSSHNHGDHTNQIDAFAAYNPLLLTGEGSHSHFEKMGFQRIVENGWWQQSLIQKEGKEIRITAVPAQHSSQTSLLDGNQMLWCGYIIEVGEQVLYFSGDTGMGHDLVDANHEKQKLFQQIRDQFGPIDVAFLPIAPQGEPLMHLDEEDALEALRVLEAQVMIPIHWGAYRTGKEQIEQPIEQLLAKAGDLEERIHVLKIGQPFSTASLFQDCMQA